jgi:hypothetical protein
MPPATAKDKLAALKTKAQPKETKSAKSSIREVDLTGSNTEKAVSDLCELAFLGNQIAPLVEQHKLAVQDAFFLRWTQEMFDNRKLPGNFKACLKKKDGDKPTTFADMACNFILKFRDDGLKSKLPKPGDMPADKTMQEVIIDMLTSGVVGLSPDNATKFVEEEVVAIDKTDFPKSLAELLAEEEGSIAHTVGNFLINCVMATTAKELGKIPVLTDEQRNAAIKTEEVIKLKDGVEERILSYVDSVDQLRKLLSFMSVTKQVSNFEFAISDDVADRNKRLVEIASRVINLST